MSETPILIPILEVQLRTERDVVLARQRARDVAASLGLDNQDQIRFATATSEIARNAFRYARSGRVAFSARLDMPQRIQVTVTDAGPGIDDLDTILEGHYQSETGLGKGITGTRRLMDEFTIETSPRGTIVCMARRIPRQFAWTQRNLNDFKQKLQLQARENPYDEIEAQNQELLKTLEELRNRQEELELLNRELEDTNRGVVALYAELDERADYLRRASELKTRFLSNVSHEFRTPLNSIISLSRLLLGKMDGDLSPEQMKQVRFIESSARDLQEMVNDLLDFAKVEAGKTRIRLKSFEVPELFSALKGMLKPLLADNNCVDLVFEDTPGLPPLHTDDGKVSQILRNLISNAIKFTPRGQVVVSAVPAGVNEVLFSVADSGIGIPPEHHETIFREFSQVENPLQERHRGTGLGLPLCRNLALLLGGQIWLESEPDRGSTFFVQIPAVYAGDAALAEVEPSLPVPEFHRIPVLFIEDHLETANSLESFVKDSEFQPVLAATVAQAEQWTATHKPSIVVSDTHLGEDTAWDFLGRLRQKWPDVPIIVTSIYEQSQLAREAGANAFLPKPFDQRLLLAELRRLNPGSAKKHLLLVDDNDVARYILRELLAQPWLEIREASNGTQALEHLRESLPDGLILDLLMPGLSGFQVLEQLRASQATQNLPVLIYSSKTLTERERALLESLRARIIPKEEVSSSLSVQPFMDWLKSSGLTPDLPARASNA